MTSCRPRPGAGSQDDHTLTAEQIEVLAVTSWTRHAAGDSPASFHRQPLRIRLANMASVEFIPVIASALGYRIIRADCGHTDIVEALADEQVEVGAWLEHLRWMRYTRHGPHPDTAHPDLLPYMQLSDEAKAKDRVRVRDIPRLLRTIGLALSHADPCDDLRPPALRQDGRDSVRGDEALDAQSDRS